MSVIVSVQDVRKIYADGFEALKGIDLEIQEGEIIALLGPNGPSVMWHLKEVYVCLSFLL